MFKNLFRARSKKAQILLIRRLQRDLNELLHEYDVATRMGLADGIDNGLRNRCEQTIDDLTTIEQRLHEGASPTIFRSNLLAVESGVEDYLASFAAGTQFGREQFRRRFGGRA